MTTTTITGLVFSKDRPMQLDAALHSFFLHCLDKHSVALKVLYITSDPFYEEQYVRLAADYGSVEFIREQKFKPQLLSCLNPHKYVLFLVDDNIFVRNFNLQQISGCLENNFDTLGFSFRLGTNTLYCYSEDKIQNPPDFIPTDCDNLKYNWTTAEVDFGYPLEVSSSIYRVEDILPLLSRLEFSNPNTLEGEMAVNKKVFSDSKRFLICTHQSITFSNPVNMVQKVCDNRAGNEPHYSTKELALLFQHGHRIKIKHYSGFIPNACHQEVELVFENSEPAGHSNALVVNFWEKRFTDAPEAHSQQNALITEDFLKTVRQNPDRFNGILSGAETVLEFGCGTGELIYRLTEEYPNIKTAVGIDISQAAINFANKNYANSRTSFEVYDVLKEGGFAGLGFFDVIISSNTLEHFRNPYHIINLMLTASTCCIILVPYNQPCNDGYDAEGGAGHVFSFYEDSLRYYNINTAIKFTTKGWQYSSQGEKPIQWAFIIGK